MNDGIIDQLANQHCEVLKERFGDRTGYLGDVSDAGYDEYHDRVIFTSSGLSITNEVVRGIRELRALKRFIEGSVEVASAT